MQLRPRGTHGVGTLVSAGRSAQAGMRDHRCPRSVIRVQPGGSCKASHDAEFGVGDSYLVVGSERDIFAAWGHLAGSGMVLLPTIVAGLRRGSGPIRAPDSGDVTEFRGGPPPRGAYKGPSGYFFLSLLPCLAFCSSWTLTPPSVVITSTPPSVVIAGLLLLFSAHTTLTPPSQLKPLLHAHHLDVSCPKQETMRQLSGGYRTTEHPPKHIGGTFGDCVSIIQRYRETVASTPLLFCFNPSSSGFLCLCVCVSWRLSI